MKLWERSAWKRVGLSVVALAVSIALLYLFVLIPQYEVYLEEAKVLEEAIDRVESRVVAVQEFGSHLWVLQREINTFKARLEELLDREVPSSQFNVKVDSDCVDILAYYRERGPRTVAIETNVWVWPLTEELARGRQRLNKVCKEELQFGPLVFKRNELRDLHARTWRLERVLGLREPERSAEERIEVLMKSIEEEVSKTMAEGYSRE